MNTVPIIIPINNTHTRNCIIEAGQRYCESTPITKKDIGLIGGSVLGILFWVTFSVWFRGFIEDRFNVDLNTSLFIIIVTTFGVPALIAIIWALI